MTLNRHGDIFLSDARWPFFFSLNIILCVQVFQKKKEKHERKSGKGCGVYGDFKLLDSLISNR